MVIAKSGALFQVGEDAEFTEANMNADAPNSDLRHSI